MHVGATLGRYQIVTKIGKGGMGEVYLAHDTSVGRDVAIKMLPADLVTDANRLRRLRREARVVASLNHPNIASLYAFEEDQGAPFLVLELVEGETLAERFRRGRMPLRAALQVAIQIADALAAAHHRGIVHRDLKPSNVMLTAQGGVKLLDFGVAAKESKADTDADTVSQDFETTRGGVVGTPAYMSPEQARGSPADQQSDIWAFGCVLYESLTGRRPFTADSRSDLIAAILEREPDWRLLDGCPGKVRDIVKRCLRKEPAARLHHIADARIELQETLEEAPSGAVVTAAGRRSTLWKAVGAGAVAVALVASGSLLRLRRETVAPSEPLRRFAIDLGSKLAFGSDYPSSVVISPKGDLLAYVAESDGERRVYIRSMDEINARPLEGTVGAQQPFFSADGKWLAFFADGNLKKISIRGGAPVALCAAPNGMGGAWSAEGWIVFAPSDPSGLWRVSENGGEPEVFTQVKSEAGEQTHRSPVLLADHRTVLFTIYTGGRNTESRIALRAPGQGEHRIVLEGGSNGHVLPPGWLIYGRGSELLAVEFNASTGESRGTPFRVLDGVQQTPMGTPIFTVSDRGTLVYAPAVTTGYAGRIVWLDRSGQVKEELEAGHPYFRPRVSPEGTRITFHFADPDYNVWVKDLLRGARWKLTKHPAYDGFGVWSPDGLQIAFCSAREGSRTIFIQSADGTAPAEKLLPVGHPRWPTSWSPKGDLLAFHEEDPRTGLHVWLLDVRNKRAEQLVHTGGHEAWARFSPDGEWLAYHSDESGSFEVYLCAVHDSARHLQVSAGGGTRPMWSPTGDQVYYYRDTQFMAAPVRLGKSPEVGRPALLFTTDMMINDVSGRGDRFLAEDTRTSLAVNRIDVVLGWSHVLARLADGR